MNLVSKFEKCHSFLQKWSSFLEFGPIRNYPNFCPLNIRPWVEELETKSISELVNLENNFEMNSIYPEFKELLQEIKSLIDFPVYRNVESKLKITTPGIRQKKEHEISQMAAMVESLENINLIDIGAGAGYLSERLTLNRNRFSYCIDCDETLQKSGIKRIGNKDFSNLEKIEFKNFYFNENAPNFKKIYDQSLVIGLHACGDLSSDIIHYFQKESLEYLMVIGCCYQKLTNKYNLSKIAQSGNLRLTTNQLNLAARSYSLSSNSSLNRKLKIRRYRYMLHCYLYSLGHKDFIPTGKTKLKDYDRNFGEYANTYAQKFIMSKKDAQSFSEETSNIKIVEKIIYTDLIRGLFGRVIEAYIALDRAIYLEENNRNVSIFELFERSQSPRNLAIFVSR